MKNIFLPFFLLLSFHTYGYEHCTNSKINKLKRTSVTSLTSIPEDAVLAVSSCALHDDDRNRSQKCTLSRKKAQTNLFKGLSQEDLDKLRQQQEKYDSTHPDTPPSTKQSVQACTAGSAALFDAE